MGQTIFLSAERSSGDTYAVLQKVWLGWQCEKKHFCLLMG